MTFLHDRLVFFFLNPLNCPLIGIIEARRLSIQATMLRWLELMRRRPQTSVRKNQATLPCTWKSVTFGYLGLEG